MRRVAVEGTRVDKGRTGIDGRPVDRGRRRRDQPWSLSVSRAGHGHSLDSLERVFILLDLFGVAPGHHHGSKATIPRDDMHCQLEALVRVEVPGTTGLTRWHRLGGRRIRAFVEQ